MKSIKVGRANNPANHVKLNDQSVSFNHLEVTYVDESTVFIKDLESANGTMIDGLPIDQGLFSITQSLQIGYQKFTGEEFFSKIKPFFLDPKVHWLLEFRALEPEFRKFEKAKANIQTRYQLKMILLRGGGVLFFVALFYLVAQYFQISTEWRILSSLFAGVLAGALSAFVNFKKAIQEEYSALRKSFRKFLVCPRCNRDLTGYPYNHWIDERKCQRCDAIWVDE